LTSVIKYDKMSKLL